MSVQQTSSARWTVGIVLAALLAGSGIYVFQAAPRKPAAVEATPAAGTISRAYATGALAAFLVKPERPPVADIAFQDGSGGLRKISDWKGRVVLLNLWATWCAPCRKEMPSLAALEARLGSKDFEVVAVSVDRKGVAAAQAFLKETGAEALHLYIEPSAAILGELNALGLPATLLIDRHGREIGRLLGPAEWSSPEAAHLIGAALAEP